MCSSLDIITHYPNNNGTANDTCIDATDGNDDDASYDNYSNNSDADDDDNNENEITIAT